MPICRTPTKRTRATRASPWPDLSSPPPSQGEAGWGSSTHSARCARLSRVDDSRRHIVRARHFREARGKGQKADRQRKQRGQENLLHGFPPNDDAVLISDQLGSVLSPPA